MGAGQRGTLKYYNYPLTFFHVHPFFQSEAILENVFAFYLFDLPFCVRPISMTNSFFEYPFFCALCRISFRVSKKNKFSIFLKELYIFLGTFKAERKTDEISPEAVSDRTKFSLETIDFIGNAFQLSSFCANLF